MQRGFFREDHRKPPTRRCEVSFLPSWGDGANEQDQAHRGMNIFARLLREHRMTTDLDWP